LSNFALFKESEMTIEGKRTQGDYTLKRIHAEIGRAACNSVAQEMVQQVRLKQPRIGTRKLYFLLRSKLASAGLKMGRDRLFEALRRAHMLIRPKRNTKRPMKCTGRL
jgi:hypothetical protein